MEEEPLTVEEQEEIIKDVLAKSDERKKAKGSSPDFRLGMLSAPSEDSRIDLVRELILSNKNNYAKARVGSAFVMTTFDESGVWMSDGFKDISEMSMPHPENPSSKSFSDMYRLNSMSMGGLSRE